MPDPKPYQARQQIDPEGFLHEPGGVRLGNGDPDSTDGIQTPGAIGNGFQLDARRLHHGGGHLQVGIRHVQHLARRSCITIQRGIRLHDQFLFCRAFAQIGSMLDGAVGVRDGFEDPLGETVASRLRKARRRPAQELLERSMGIRQFLSPQLVAPGYIGPGSDPGQLLSLPHSLQRREHSAAGEKRQSDRRDDKKLPLQRPVAPTHQSR